MVQRTRKLLVIGAAIIGVALFTKTIIISPTLVQTITTWVSYPALLVQDTIVVPIRKFFERRHTIDELTALVRKYHGELELLRADYITIAAACHHERETDEVRQFKERYKTDYAVVAQIIFKQISPIEHICFIDAGMHKGVLPDMIAVYKNCLVGRVSEVYPTYSKIVLISDHASKVPAVCIKTSAHGILEGTNNAETTKLSFISHLQAVEVGDLVITSGDGLIYPKGFALGTIENVSLDELGLTHIVSVKPAVQITDIRYCCLVQKGAEFKEALPALVEAQQLS